MKESTRTIPVISFNSPAGSKFLADLDRNRQSRDEETTSKVAAILTAVKKKGDRALVHYTETYDGIRLSPSSLRISGKEIDDAAARCTPRLKATIKAAASRITAYHKQQLRNGFSIKTAEGVLSQIIRPLQRVGLYIPGGHTVYPSSVLMNALPAIIAGVPEIVAITPPRPELDPGIAFALKFLKISEVYRIGGAQGIAALAYGTKTVPAVDKIVGPGNSYVQTAKRLVYGTVDIDSVAGPSEVAIIADTSVSSEWVALDLLSQAEHGSGDELAVCVTEDIGFAIKIAATLQKELHDSPVREKLLRLPKNSLVIVVTGSRDESILVINKIAPEHLQIMTTTAEQDCKKVKNAAAIFLGPYTPVALGDYFIGTNHVLPTGGSARFASPLGVDSFVKRISVAKVSPQGLDAAAPFVSIFARSEAFIHHALSVERRN